MRTDANLPLAVRRIILTGFMGAGKSTIGALLAERLGWRFTDTDAVIEARTGQTISQIFAEKGEEAFRILETDAICDCGREDCLVLALGGGAVESGGTRNALSQLDEACIVFLDAPLDVMVARCVAQPHAAERPVLADRERLATRLAARLPHYRMAHLTVSTANLAPENVAESILEFLREQAAAVPAVDAEKR